MEEEELYSMKPFPCVSLIIISYKHADYIRDCMESILGQTYTDMEILYLDDCSGDGTYEVALEYLEKLERKFSKVIFHKNESNQGVVRNLNRLLKQCCGKYVKFLAADDFMLPNGIEDMVTFMEKFPDMDMLYSNGVMGNATTHFPIGEVNEYPRLYEEEQPSGTGLFPLLYENDFIAAPGVMIRQTVYEKLGAYDETMGIEDWEYFLRVAEQGQIGFLNKLTVCYRILDSSLSHSANPARRMNMSKSELLILEKYKDKIRDSYIRLSASLNEALCDAFHIDNAEYIDFLKEYAKRNGIKISMRNRAKEVLYYMGIIRRIEKSLEDK